jgi:hypothetical protein
VLRARLRCTLDAPQSAVWHMHFSLDGVNIVLIWSSRVVTLSRTLTRRTRCRERMSCSVRRVLAALCVGLVLESGFWTQPRELLIDFRSRGSLFSSPRTYVHTPLHDDRGALPHSFARQNDISCGWQRRTKAHWLHPLVNAEMVRAKLFPEPRAKDVLNTSTGLFSYMYYVRFT